MPSRRKTQIELERMAASKAIRQVIRLKHAIEADREINERLYNFLEDFDEAIAAGKSYEFSLAEIIDDVKRLPA